MDCRAVVAAGLFRVGGPFTGRERYRTDLVLESRKARGLECPGIQDVEVIELMVFWEAVEVGPMLAANKVSRAAAERKRERCFLVFTAWAVGHAIR